MNDFERLASEVEDLTDDLNDVAHDRVEQEAEIIEGKARATVSKVSGRMASSIRTRSRTYTLGSQVQVVAGHEGVTIYPAFLEYGTGNYFGTSGLGNLPTRRYSSPSGQWGTGDHSPLVANIQEWIEMKGITGTFYSPLRRDDGSASPLAFAIARAITRHGTKPHPFMRPAWQGHQRTIPVNVGSGVRRRIRYVESRF